jgi:hypothetical protein
MSEGTTLKWRQHQLSISERDALRSLTRRSLLGATRLAGPTPSDSDHEIQLPELPATPLEKAVSLLRAASQIEHALMVQYLYAGYSFQPTQRELANVAIEEMSHLMTVQNLLRLLGEAPYLYRQDYGPPMNEDERLFPFDLRLEPLSHVSLAKYVVAESPASIPPGVDPSLLAHIMELAMGPAHEPINRVSTLYALLGVVLEASNSYSSSLRRESHGMWPSTSSRLRRRSSTVAATRCIFPIARSKRRPHRTRRLTETGTVL